MISGDGVRGHGYESRLPSWAEEVTPKYVPPPALAGSADSLAAALAAHLPDQPVTATSVVTYLVAGAKPGTPR